MFQVRKSRFCGISVIFSQCCFMSETQVLMTISDFWDFFLRIIFWKGYLFFNGRVSFLSEGHPMRSISFDGGGLKKIMGWRAPLQCLSSHYGKTLREETIVLRFGLKQPLQKEQLLSTWFIGPVCSVVVLWNVCFRSVWSSLCLAFYWNIYIRLFRLFACG